jgi:N-acetylneuraminic acid mutarotase
MSGSNIVGANGGQPGVYGSLGVASASNIPGGRVGAISWTDSSGDLWLFGGNGYDSTDVGERLLNDLWEFNISTKEWTWVSGSDIGTPVSSASGTPGVYGALGVASAANTPGKRYTQAGWTDSSGNLWLFGGAGFDSTGASGGLNDLWEFSPTSRMWTWVSGSNLANGSAVFGTQGIAAPSNVPGTGYLSVSWTDKSGNFWLYEGNTVPSCDDVWEFTPTTKMWTWVTGGDTGGCVTAVYGTQGVASPTNTPGGRAEGEATWTDAGGNFWLLGGGPATSGGTAMSNDLWEFNISTKEWTWVSGDSSGSGIGVYGTLGVAAPGNVPGHRANPNNWTDSSGNLWLFGGQGIDSTGASGWLNDLWEFSPSTKEWTWMGGSDSTYANAAQYQADRGQPGIYGTEGVPAATNVPGGRYSAVSWTDSSGNFWLFGGEGHDSTAAQIGNLNDLWRYQP